MQWPIFCKIYGSSKGKFESYMPVVLHGPVSSSNIGLRVSLLPLSAEKNTMDTIHLFKLAGTGLWSWQSQGTGTVLPPKTLCLEANSNLIFPVGTCMSLGDSIGHIHGGENRVNRGVCQQPGGGWCCWLIDAAARNIFCHHFNWNLVTDCTQPNAVVFSWITQNNYQSQTLTNLHNNIS